MEITKVAILGSGAGTNAEKIIDYFKGNECIEIQLVCTNKPNAGIIEIAAKNSIPVIIFSQKDFDNNSLLENLKNEKITHIVLAGFLWLLPPSFIKIYANKIINIHPALLPKYGGKGMFGINVHQAVKEACERETGITIHLVTENYDEGAHFAQEKTTLIGNETVVEIAKKVQVLEHHYYPIYIHKWITTEQPNSLL